MISLLFFLPEGIVSQTYMCDPYAERISDQLRTMETANGPVLKKTSDPGWPQSFGPHHC